ncbi:MAG: ribose-phosphate pyrophosphokinase [bacterium]
MKNMRIFSGSGNRVLTQRIVDYLGIPMGKAEITKFSDGEISVKFCENIRGIDVFIVQPTNPPCSNLMELLLLIDAARRASAKRITAVIPYFGYARQDRKDQPRVAISAKLVANLLSTAGANRILTMDLHSASIQGFFDIPFDHLYALPIFLKALKRKKKGNGNLVVVAPDVGSSGRAQSYAKRLNAGLCLVDKKRSKANEIKSATLIGNVEDKDVVLVDDIVDTAGTLCKAAGLLKKSGAKNVTAACTHPILSGDAIQKINQSAISQLFVTDSIPISDNKEIKKIEVVSSAELFSEAIRRIHNEESISSLFH